MINDNIKQLNRYAVPKAEAILKFIAAHNCAELEDGEKEIEGRELFVRIMSYVPKPADQNKFETHEVYADLQYVATGTEIMQTAESRDLTPTTGYDAKDDYRFYNINGPVNSLVVRSGFFTVFYPNEAHRPSCLFDGHRGMVKKLVFKIKMSNS